jgi:hypothetical protein
MPGSCAAPTVRTAPARLSLSESSQGFRQHTLRHPDRPFDRFRGAALGERLPFGVEWNALSGIARILTLGR